MADVTLVQSNFLSFFWEVRTTLKLDRKTLSEHSGVIYQSNQKGLLYKTGYSSEVLD
jgi:hypothetical protein